MSDAETSAYLLIAAGVFWLMMGIVGLSRGVKAKDEALEQDPEQPDASSEESHAPKLHKLDLRMPNASARTPDDAP